MNYGRCGGRVDHTRACGDATWERASPLPTPREHSNALRPSAVHSGVIFVIRDPAASQSESSRPHSSSIEFPRSPRPFKRRLSTCLARLLLEADDDDDDEEEVPRKISDDCIDPPLHAATLQQFCRSPRPSRPSSSTTLLRCMRCEHRIRFMPRHPTDRDRDRDRREGARVLA